MSAAGWAAARANGAAGTPGTAASSLTLSNLVASALTGSSIAIGGVGGGVSSGGNANGTNGATAASDISFTGKGNVTVTAIGTGRQRRQRLWQREGGKRRRNRHGDGERHFHDGRQRHPLRADNTGGNGGGGPIGGNGADATLINAATGSTTGLLTLTQNAIGGNGAGGSTGAAGTPGDAISTLVFNQSGPSGLNINSTATGGGNAGSFSAASGATAISSIDATCTGTVHESHRDRPMAPRVA